MRRSKTQTFGLNLKNSPWFTGQLGKRCACLELMRAIYNNVSFHF